jgi:hypothetical protein
MRLSLKYPISHDLGSKKADVESSKETIKLQVFTLSDENIQFKSNQVSDGIKV